MFPFNNFLEWLGNLSGRIFPALMIGAVAVFGSDAFAQVSEPTEGAALGDIVFPIELASIATTVAAAGATMIGLWAVYKIGFKFVRKFITRMGSAV